MNLYSAMKNFNAEGQRSRGAEENEENSVSLCLCDKTHLRPREVVAVIISRFSPRSFYITFVAGSFGDLEIFLILLLTQRHKGTETQSFLTGLTGFTGFIF